MQTNPIDISAEADCIIMHKIENHHMHFTITRELYECMTVSRVASTIQWNFWMYIFLLLILKFWIKMTFFSEFLERVEIVASKYILQFLT